MTLAPPFGPDDTYWRMWSALWNPHLGGIVNVEADIIVPDSVMVDLINCPNDWCAAPYPYLDRDKQFGLGAVKFSASLIERHRSMWQEIGDWYDSSHPPRHWCRLDAWSYQYLTGEGEVRCEDHGFVHHLGQPSTASGHGCYQIPPS